MAEFLIREHAVGDKPFLREMLEMAAVPTYPELLQLGRISLRERLDAIFEQAYCHPEKRIWVAEDTEQNRAGMVWIQPSFHPVTELPDFLVLNVAVRPRHRGRGLAEALMDTAKAHAASRGIQRLRLFVSAVNTPAVTLYEKLGYQEQTREMLLKF